MRIRSETTGAFIDAVYAIAVTILALELPGSLDDAAFDALHFAAILLEYAVAFGLLFSFWLQHRRINAMVETVGRASAWTTAAILMLVCLVPRATTLVFELGANVTFAEVRATVADGAGWSTAEIVDGFYVLTVLAVDLGILFLLRLHRPDATPDDAQALRHSKATTTVLLLLLVGFSFLLPFENRYFLLIIPVALFFEDEISRLVGSRTTAAG